MRYIILLFVFVSLMACHENPPVIPPLGPQEVGERRVLIEEFTGVRCPNCPDGSAEIENLVALYGENLVPISIHSSGNFAIPLADSKFDFRTEVGDQLLEFLGQPLGYPSAVVNRVLPDGATRLQQGQASWAGLIEKALAEDPEVAINVEIDFDTATRQLEVSTRTIANQTINEALRISLMLVEDHVIDPQLTQNGIIDTYDHRHVLRAMLTKPDGDALGDNFKAGTVIEYKTNITVSEAWMAENCEVVVFVHRVGDSKEVLQVETVHL